jgi:hypothetical protein
MEDTYEWEDINLALMELGYGPRTILNILVKLSKNKKERQ